MTTFSLRQVRSRAAAFTLIELLTSMAVLVLLVVAVSQIVNGTTTLSTANRQHLDADNQARLVFDRMALDFGRMLKRPDVDYIFAPQAGDDKFFFYTEAPGFFYNGTGGTAIEASAQSPLSLVGYRVNSQGQKDPYQLSRLGKGLQWDEGDGPAQGATEPASIMFLTPSGTPLPSPTPTSASTPVPTPFPSTTLSGRWPNTVGKSPDYNYDEKDTTALNSYHVIAGQVCRMEVCFLLKPRPATATAGPQPARYSLEPFYKVDGLGNQDPQHSAVYGLQDVQAIVVALAVLDRTSRQRVTDLSLLSKETTLRDIKTADLDPVPPTVSTTPATLMAKIWQDKIDSGTLAADAKIPASVVSQLRVYQRHFYLGTY